MATLGEYLREERMMAGLSQEGLRDISGVPQQTISELERDVKPAENLIKQIRQITEALGCSTLHAFALGGLLEFRNPEDRDAAEILIHYRELSGSQRDKVREFIGQLKEDV